MVHFFVLFSALLTSALGFPGTTYDLSSSKAIRDVNQAAGIPLPSLAQLKGSLQHQFTVFMHWSMCTYTGCQWNTAVSPPSNFTPPDVGPNITQWMEAVKDLGATQVCLTVRHVGGFTLWPSATTNYSVAGSPWRGGKGDIVADFTAAARASGISPCLYIILGFDVQANHTGVPGPVYIDHQVMALTELLTNYGQIDRLWWGEFFFLHPPNGNPLGNPPLTSHSPLFPF
jgi:alpha-L-fucosidase